MPVTADFSDKKPHSYESVYTTLRDLKFTPEVMRKSEEDEDEPVSTWVWEPVRPVSSKSDTLVLRVDLLSDVDEPPCGSMYIYGSELALDCALSLAFEWLEMNECARDVNYGEGDKFIYFNFHSQATTSSGRGIMSLTDFYRFAQCLMIGFSSGQFWYHVDVLGRQHERRLSMLRKDFAAVLREINENPENPVGKSFRRETRRINGGASVGT